MLIFVTDTLFSIFVLNMVHTLTSCDLLGRSPLYQISIQA
jgi:hypothetical protein